MQPEDSDIYDSVSDDQYKAIVGSRLEQDDFIVDDDGSGYVDNGQDDWEDDKRRRRGSDEDDDDDDESETERAGGCNVSEPDGSLPRRPASKKKTKGKPKPEKPKATMADYRRPPTAAYRPQVSALNEQDFMAGLLSSVSAGPSTDARKRKSSPDYLHPSSEGVDLSSDSSFFDGGISNKRFGMDDMGGWQGKKQRVDHEALSVKDEPMDLDDLDFGMDMNGNHSESLAISDDDDLEIGIKPIKRDPSTPTASRLGAARKGPTSSLAAQTARRRAVNATATAVKTAPIIPKVELKPSTPSASRPKPTALSWQAVSDSIVSTDPAIDTVKAQLNSTIEPLEQDGSMRMFWFDYLEVNDDLHLIGKVKDRASDRYVSCCVTIKGIERNLFFLPRKTRFGA